MRRKSCSMQPRSPEDTGGIPSFSSRFVDLTARKAEGSTAQDFAKLSRQELDEALEVLISAMPAGDAAVDRLQRLVHEMQVYRCELEMQNRSLRESQDE